MRMPVDTLLSHWAYMVMTALARTLKAWFALRLPDSRPSRACKSTDRLSFACLKSVAGRLPPRVRSVARAVARLKAVRKPG